MSCHVFYTVFYWLFLLIWSSNRESKSASREEVRLICRLADDLVSCWPKMAAPLALVCVDGISIAFDDQVAKNINWKFPN